MEAAVFFKLVARLPAYRSVLAARVAAESRGGSASNGHRATSSYDRGSGMANRAVTADSAPPATAGTIAALSASVGGGWFAYKTTGAPALAGAGR
jgi:hypothetical protein